MTAFGKFFGGILGYVWEHIMVIFKDIGQFFVKLFKDIISSQLRFMLINEVLECLAKPLFEGNIPPLMSPETYNMMRKDMYENLLTKYVDNEKEDSPF